MTYSSVRNSEFPIPNERKEKTERNRRGEREETEKVEERSADVGGKFDQRPLHAHRKGSGVGIGVLRHQEGIDVGMYLRIYVDTFADVGIVGIVGVVRCVGSVGIGSVVQAVRGPAPVS